MSTVATKIKAGVAAGALAGAAALATVPVAQAETFATGLGAGAGAAAINTECDDATSEDCVAPAVSSSSGLLPGGYTLLQNKLLWWGPTADVTPTLTPLVEVQLTNFIPSIFGLKEAFGWVEQLDFTTCVAGATAKIGSYGTLTIGVSKGCAV
ncbi:hypothetical protein [Mycolicibacterium palauense]|uniref:hypothetical protein n=1 Tax=Mycolicibacterium palauense TaxID=2034511 RepID=UPI000BFED130|nr:hypothetical protein [Mycolicibacterium palauense]